MNRKQTTVWLLGTALAFSAGTALAGGAHAGHDANQHAQAAQAPSDAGQTSTYGGGLSSDANATGNEPSAADANRNATAADNAPSSESSNTAQSQIDALTGNGNTTGAGTALSSAEPSSGSTAQSPNESRDSTSDSDTLGPNWRGSKPGTSTKRPDDRPDSVKL